MAKQLPKLFYGLHFCDGVAEYQNENDRIFISEATAKSMDASFSGCPVYVGHKSADIEKIQEADGYVVRSFFNKNDGKHWAEFMAVSDDAHEAIANGWKLSNAYTIKKQAEGGRWHNVEYAYEVLEGEYNHLAIVQTPRYSESVILTAEEFKEYNKQKENELKTLTNSLGKKFMFKFFKKDQVENAKELSEMTVSLKNGQEMSIASLIELVEKRNEMDKEEEEKKEKEAKDKEEEEKRKANEEEKKKEEEEEAKKKANEEAEAKKKEEEEKLNEIKNAMENQNSIEVVDTSINKIVRGQRLYGSSK